jgi:hypothetical protein
MKYLLLTFTCLFVAIIVAPILVYGFTQPVGLGLLVGGGWLFLLLATIYEKVNAWLLKRRRR